MQVMVECRQRNMAMFAVASGLPTLVSVVVFGPLGLLYVLLPLSVMGAGHLWMRACTRSLSRRNNREADYLVRRIEAAVAGTAPAFPQRTLSREALKNPRSRSTL